LEGIHYASTSRASLPEIVITTLINGLPYVRELSLPDDGFAARLSQFLSQRKGMTIEQIGELEITF
jgi:hypothetical protein